MGVPLPGNAIYVLKRDLNTKSLVELEAKDSIELECIAPNLLKRGEWQSLC